MSICATIGRPIIINIGTCIHDGFVVFRDISKDVNTEYLFYLLQANEPIFIKQRQSGTQGNLNTTIVGETKIALPPLTEQKQIVKILSNIDTKIELEYNYKEKLIELKKALMQVLLTGKVRVKVDADAQP